MISKHRQPCKTRTIFGFAIAATIAAVSFTEAQSQPATTPASNGAAMPPGDAVTAEQNLQQNTNEDTDRALTKSPQSEPTSNTIFDGAKPFTLKVAENNGELIYTFNENTKALESIEAKTKVVFASEGTTISCDNLVFTSSTQELLASGPGLVAHLGPVQVTAGELRYKPGEGEWHFWEDVEVTQKENSGRVTTTAGTAISIRTDPATGMYRIMVKTGGDELYIRPDR